MIMKELKVHYDVLVLGKTREQLNEFIKARCNDTNAISWEVDRTRAMVMVTLAQGYSYTTAYKTVLLNGTVDQDYETTWQSCCGMRLSSVFFCDGLYDSNIHNYIQSRLRGKSHESH